MTLNIADQLFGMNISYHRTPYSNNVSFHQFSSVFVDQVQAIVEIGGEIYKLSKKWTLPISGHLSLAQMVTANRREVFINLFKRYIVIVINEILFTS